MRRLALFLGLVLVTAVPRSSALGAAPPAAAPSEPVVSALVTVAGPSVFQQFAGMTEPAGRADAVTQQAAALAPDLARAEASVQRGQTPVVVAAKGLGVRVISRYTTAANGLLVHATATQLAALRAVPGVVRVERAPLLRPALGMSGPHIGATRLAEEMGYDGEGTVVAVIDTGVDYTHAHLGGPGTAEVWDAASVEGLTETITDTWDGKVLFPNDKVIGGWDFVGRHYDPPHICTPEREAAGECTTTPHPDPDPLDGASHGTHVSGIVAGKATAGLSDGVAPGAQLVGLKVYGRGGADEAVDMTVDAIEWCTRVNLGLEDRGVLPPRVDAINISLGEPHAQGSRFYDEAVEAAVASGIVVVASAGNSGNRAFVAGTPSASPMVLSVANALPPSLALEIETRWEDQAEITFGLESTIGQPLEEAGRIEAELAWFGRGCDGDEVHQDPTGKMALVERGECNFSEKLLGAQNAGATSVLMFTDNRGKTSMGGSSAGIEIPAAMIDRPPGLALVALLEAGTPVTAVLDPARFGVDMSRADAISGSSSRGPSKNGALKPDITGPGTGILSALRGTGDGGAAWSGTSMSGPHVAGAAALMHNRNRAEGLGLGAADLAALLMNYARPVVFQGSGEDKTTVPVARQGAGQVDLWRAGNGPLLVRAGDIASIHLAAVSLTRPERYERSLHVRNLSSALVRFAVDAAMLYEGDVDRGVTVETPPVPLVLPPGAKAEVPVVFTLDPAAMRAWTLRPSAGASVNAVTDMEFDGYITLTPLGPDGAPSIDVPAASVPFYVLPRSAARVGTRGLPAVGEDGDDTLVLRNTVHYTGTAELFVAPVDTSAGTDTEDPDEEDVLRELDLRRVGVRFDPPTETVTHTNLTFAFARHEVAPIPQVTRFEVYLDTDGDGATDYRVRDGAQGDRMRTYFGEWDPEAGGIRGEEFITDTLHSTDLYTHLSTISVPIENVGLAAPAPLEFYVVHRGLNEDWLGATQTDVAPDGANEPGGPRYRFDPAALARVPEQWTATLAGKTEQPVPLLATDGDWDATLLALYPDNRFEDDARQMQALRPGEMAPKVWQGLLPLLMRRAQ